MYLHTILTTMYIVLGLYGEYTNVYVLRTDITMEIVGT